MIEKYNKNIEVKINNIIPENSTNNAEKTVKEKADDAGKDAIIEIIIYFNKNNSIKC